MEATNRALARLLRRLADYVEDNGIDAAMELLLPGTAIPQRPAETKPTAGAPPPPVAPAPAASPRREPPQPHVVPSEPEEARPRPNASRLLPQGAPSGRRLIPLSQWPEYHDWPPLGGLRHLVFNARYNGFDKVIRRVGRRVLLDEEAFFEWVEKEGGKPWSVEPERKRRK